MTTISFPGLGIPEFTINPIAIPFGERGIYWYALIIVYGMLIAMLYASCRAKDEGISFDTMIDFALYTIPVGIIGARLYYVFFDWLARPENYKSFKDIIAIWDGGLAIYGGIIFGIATIFIVAKIKKMSWKTLFKLFDSVAPGVMIAQAIGRWGNFCNGEAFGGETDLPWRMGLISSNTINTFNTEDMVYVHPTFLYESLWNILGFILINLVYKKKRFDGQITLMYIAWYGFGRTFIELLRTDSLTNGGNIRVSSVLGLACFLVAGTLLVIFFIKNKGKKTYGDAVALSATSVEGAQEAATEAVTESDEENAEESAQGLDASDSINTQENQESKEVDDDGKVD